MGTQESSDMLGWQLHNRNPVKYGKATCLPHKGGGVPLSALPKNTTSKLSGALKYGKLSFTFVISLNEFYVIVGKARLYSLVFYNCFGFCVFVELVSWWLQLE